MSPGLRHAGGLRRRHPRLRQGGRPRAQPRHPGAVPPRGRSRSACSAPPAVGGPAGVVRRRRLGRAAAGGRRGQPPRPPRRRDDGPAARGHRRAGPGDARARAAAARRRIPTPAGLLDLRARTCGGGAAAFAHVARPPARAGAPVGGRGPAASAGAAWRALVEQPAEHARALGHPQRQPAPAPRRASWSSSTGGVRSRPGLARPPPRPARTGRLARGSTRPWPPHRRWPARATRRSPPGWSVSGPSGLACA